MPHLIRKRILSFLAFVTLLAGACAQAWAQPAPPPIEAFFDNPSFSGGKISPTGRHVALQVRPKNGRIQLVVMDTEKLGAKVVASFLDIDVIDFDWVNEKRLVFTVYDLQGGVISQQHANSGLMAVEADGTGMRQLSRIDWLPERGVGGRMALDPSTRFHSTTQFKDSEDIFVTQAKFTEMTYEIASLNLLRVNTTTANGTIVQRPGESFEWFIDAQDVPRAVYTGEKGKGAIHYLDPANKAWTQLIEFDRMTGDGGFMPVGFGPDGTMYVSSRQKTQGGVYALYKYDLAKKQVESTPIVSMEGFDVAPRFVWAERKLVGLQYTTDAEGVAWFDAAYKDLQARIDKALPGTINSLRLPERGEAPFVLVHSYSDQEPGAYVLYNTQTNKATVLGRSMPGIAPRQMAQRDFVRFKARDGHEVPAWVTLPKDAKGRKLPMVVLVHGGPWVRGGYWKWDADSQFLASRGYVVVEPEFRGSSGYGFSHFKAGWKEWGKAMQNDVADAAKWAIAKGYADPDRVCIAGASYGGYSTLMGLVNDPDLFKCGVNWVGVTDIDLMYSVTWSDFTQAYKQYGMPVLVGDREKDAAQLKATSPLYQAERIKQPLLLAYGGRDRRVPIVHGTKFRDAVMKSNPNVEWVDYPEEGHGWLLVKTRVDFWGRVEKFLARHIGAQRQGGN